MSSQDLEQIYRDFVSRILIARRVWSVSCCGEIVAVHGGPRICVPLFPDRASARYFTTRYWPDLQPVSLSLRELIETHLPFFTDARVPVGLGIAPLENAIALSPERLRKDLIAAQAGEGTPSLPALDA